MQNQHSQRGAALILSLLLLLVLTLLAVSSMQNTVMQERMVSAEREGIISLEIAESGLRDAEAFVEALSNLNGFTGSDGLYPVGEAGPDPLDAATWAGTASVAGQAVPDVGVTPRYFIVHEGEARQPEGIMEGQGYGGSSSPDAQAFRIVAWSPGLSGESQRVIETFYVRRGF